MGRSKEEVARELVRAHFEVEPGLSRVLVIRSDDWDDPEKPIKLLEINANTMPSGSVEAYAFSPTKETPYPTLIAEITPEEYAQIELKKIALPRGWSLDNPIDITRAA